MKKANCIVRFTFPHFYKVDNEILNFLNEKLGVRQIDSQDGFSMEKRAFETVTNVALYYLFPDFIDLSLDDSKKIVEWYIDGKINIQLFYQTKSGDFPHGIYSNDFFRENVDTITDYIDDDRLIAWKDEFSKYDNM